MGNKKVIYLPAQINPLIKLTRWILLIAGIVYGIGKHERYSILAQEEREEEERLRPEKEAKLAREKEILIRSQLKVFDDVFPEMRYPDEENNQKNDKNNKSNEKK